MRENVSSVDFSSWTQPFSQPTAHQFTAAVSQPQLVQAIPSAAASMATLRIPPVVHSAYKQPAGSECVYRGPAPTSLRSSHPDPSAFARLRLTLENLLPPDATELFKHQTLLDNLKVKEAKLIAVAFLNSPTPYLYTMVALNEKFEEDSQCLESP